MSEVRASTNTVDQATTYGAENRPVTFTREDSISDVCANKEHSKCLPCREVEN